MSITFAHKIIVRYARKPTQKQIIVTAEVLEVSRWENATACFEMKPHQISMVTAGSRAPAHKFAMKAGSSPVF